MPRPMAGETPALPLVAEKEGRMRTETQRIYKERILRVLLHIQGNLDEPLA